MAAPLFGCYPNAYARVDHIVRDARDVTLREQTEPVHGVACFVVDAKTKYGDYTLWIDPEHGFNVAKAQIHASQEQKHWYLDKPVRGNWSSMIEISQFREFNGMWVAIEGTVDQLFDLPQGGSHTSKSCIQVTELSLNPDHESLGSFAHGDVVDGTWGWVAPYDHIKCIWEKGTFTPMFDHDAVRQIDETIATLLAEQKGESPADLTDASRPGTSDIAPSSDPTLSPQQEDGAIHAEGEAGSSAPESQGNVKTKNRRAPYPHCGLYCVYSMTGLLGQQVDFESLMKPKYLGAREGSSLLELRQAALDLGLETEPVGRLSAPGLSHCPYPAILHVRLYPESPKYDHYELFLGVEQGKAKLFNPPQAPRLVSFPDLATRWDGSALFISRAPIETDLILAADRQHLLWYSMIGLLVILAGHIGRRVWLSLMPRITRRWALGLTVGQVSALALAAVLCAGAYHLFSEGGLLANAVATQALQKGYAGTFIPKVRAETVNRLLGTDAVFIDARLPADYNSGHLDGAISLPVNADDTLWKETLARIPQGRPIITYCQSAGCKYAEKVSLRLIEEGYSDISIFRGGWAEWTAREKAEQSRVSRVQHGTGFIGDSR